ncbi:hypothetical protein OH687_13590 [Burkholderia anthina]|nr:hypothetical protein OH687_13590 [Burkholderia anthina]
MPRTMLSAVARATFQPNAGRPLVRMDRRRHYRTISDLTSDRGDSEF